jgi:hypothetical protein
MMGRGLSGTVTEVAADHYTIKTDAGETYTVHFSANTRILKQAAGMRGAGERRQGGGEGGGNPPQMLKSTDIKVGDAIAAMGEIDAAAKSVAPWSSFRSIPSAPNRCARCRPTTAKPGSWARSRPSTASRSP